MSIEANPDSRAVAVRKAQGLARFQAEGHEYADPEASYLEDGKYPPFVVFDVDAQRNITNDAGELEEYATRELAEARADHLNANVQGAQAPEGGDDGKTYSVVRYRFKGENETIKTGLTLAQAQEHCSREDTHGEGWFDGYTEE